MIRSAADQHALAQSPRARNRKSRTNFLITDDLCRIGTLFLTDAITGKEQLWKVIDLPRVKNSEVFARIESPDHPGFTFQVSFILLGLQPDPKTKTYTQISARLQKSGPRVSMQKPQVGLLQIMPANGVTGVAL